MYTPPLNGDTDAGWKQDFLSNRRFTEEQQHQLRDIRRRGKNKVDLKKYRKGWLKNLK